MMHKLKLTLAFAALAVVGALATQEPPAEQVAQERAQAELDAPKLVDVLELKRRSNLVEACRSSISSLAKARKRRTALPRVARDMAFERQP